MKKLLLSFDGRVSRFTYWLASLGSVAAYLIALLAAILIIHLATSTRADKETPNVVATLILLLPLLWAGLAISTKRWHDRGKSGWWNLVLFVPVAGALWALIECGFLRGMPGANKYGADPLAKAAPVGTVPGEITPAPMAPSPQAGAVSAERLSLPESGAPAGSTPATTDEWPWSKILRYALLPKPKGSPKAGKKEIGLRLGIASFFAIILFGRFFSSGGLPACSSADARELVSKIVNDLPIAKRTGARFVSLKDVVELGYNKERELRSCSSILITTAGEDEFQYSIEWRDKAKGIFFVNARVVR